MKINLNGHGLILVSGEDAKLFLQNQFSNDINAITDNKAQLNAYCTHQGRVVASLWAMRFNGDFLLFLPNDLIETVIKRLRMYVLNSKVVLSDVSEQYQLLAMVGNETITDAIFSCQLADCCLALYPRQNNNKIMDLLPECHWHFAMIKRGIATIFSATSEAFIPQMLNFDLAEVAGVSFTKGCYPGQEVVARLHYLGKAKRRLFRLKTKETALKINDVLYTSNGQTRQKSGIIVNVASDENGSVCLAVMAVADTNNDIFLNEQTAIKMEVINGHD